MQVKILHMRKLHSWKRRNKAFQVYQSLPLSTTQARSHNSRNEDCRPETTSAFCGMAEVPQKKDHLMNFGGIIPKGFMHITHMLHVWYIYLHDWVIFRANVGKYTIHGAYGWGRYLPAQFSRDMEKTHINIPFVSLRLS